MPALPSRSLVRPTQPPSRIFNAIFSEKNCQRGFLLDGHRHAWMSFQIRFLLPLPLLGKAVQHILTSIAPQQRDAFVSWKRLVQRPTFQKPHGSVNQPRILGATDRPRAVMSSQQLVPGFAHSPKAEPESRQSVSFLAPPCRAMNHQHTFGVFLPSGALEDRTPSAQM